MIVHYTQSFKKDFLVLPEDIQNLTAQKILFFIDNERHPSLHIKKIQGTLHVWEGRITIHYRFTFIRDGDEVYLRRIGTHDVLRNP